jgi:predicted CXXCH cytochrome family protein
LRTQRRLSARGILWLCLFWLLLCVAAAVRSSAARGEEEHAPAGGAAQPSPDATTAPHKPIRTDLDAPGPNAQMVGTTFCGGPNCHGAMMAEFNRLRHSHYVSDPKYGDAAGCEICHGPASDHVADRQRRHMFRFTVQSTVNARRVNEACMRCHQETIDRPHFLATEHGRAGVSCASCHEVHYDLGTPYLLRYPGAAGPAGQPSRERRGRAVAAAPVPVPAPGPQSPVEGVPTPQPPSPAPPATEEPLQPPAVTPPAAAPRPPSNVPKLAALAKTRVPIPRWRSSFTREPSAVTEEQAVSELCASCHRRQIMEFRQFSHHPVPEGRIRCTDCHDPHRSGEQGRNLRRRTVEETCLQCHQQIRGPFVYEHEPVKAVGGVGDACLECHRPHGSPNRKLEVMFSRGLCVQCHVDIQRDPPHQARGGDCWRSNCHVAIHGSNQSPLFFRE